MFPKSFDPSHYRNTYPDLQHLSDDGLRLHYAQYGESECRAPSPINSRTTFVSAIQEMNHESILEIGPFAAPLLSGPNILYFDILSTEDLKVRAIEHDRDPENVPVINFVDPLGDLTIIKRKFSAVISSHCIEHQPDLITHLNQVSDLLEQGGKYYLIFPDKRFCFDHFVPETSISELIASYVAKHTYHQLDKILKHRLEVTHNNPVMHWKGEHGNKSFGIPKAELLTIARNIYETAKVEYIDVHAWFFTPKSFALVMKELRELGLTDLVVDEIYPTVKNDFNIFAVLAKSDSA
jgi:SAM-dependent methyltransferase